jgi:diaminohydroxyphosphoribosylaminopyrimidine deaminase/5-amino-6-(5-phosphoribosylamino)uracil reductase
MPEARFESSFGFLVDPPAPEIADDPDERFLLEAYVEALKGVGRTNPNPPVGCVIVKGGRIVARGHHAKVGGPHAEVVALDAAGPMAKGATAYVTLEPCVHTGRTGPCVDRVIAAGIKRVVVGSKDPNPLVSGRGLAKLRRAGVEVSLRSRGAGGRRCAAMIAPFAAHITAGRPWVVAKVAATLDGRVATRTGHARWVTGPKSRRLVHELRNRVDAVMVGAGTVLKDDPMLTVRGLARGARDPRRVILDGRGRVPAKARALAKGEPAPIVLTTRLGSPEGTEHVRCKAKGKHVDLKDALAKLGERGLTSVLVECGPGLLTALVDGKLIDELWWFTAPALVGDDGVGALGPRKRTQMDRVPRLENPGRYLVGEDVLFIGNP